MKAMKNTGAVLGVAATYTRILTGVLADVAVDKVKKNPGKTLAIGVVTVASGGGAVYMAPWIGGAVSAAGFGVAGGTLSGAAATSAGLAFLGGGSLAAGGAGMAGGVVMCGAAGTVTGLGLSSVGVAVGSAMAGSNQTPGGTPIFEKVVG